MTNLMKPLQFIDTHHHLWDLNHCHYPWLMAKGEQRFFGDPTPIQKNYLINDFLSESPHFRPLQSVHIQVGVTEQDSVRESQWLQQQETFPQAVVAFCDLTADDRDTKIEQHMQFAKVRGFRQIIGRHSEEDRKHNSNALLQNPKWLQGLQSLAKKNLSFDLQMTPPQLPAVLKILKQVPELKVALCHCGSPWDQTPEGLKSWRQGLKQLAELPNVFCKVSGLGMFNPQWATADLRPVILDTIDIFEPTRVMFGSNFPVDKLYRSYDSLWSAYSDITGVFSTAEKKHFFIDTATRFYRLNL